MKSPRMPLFLILILLVSFLHSPLAIIPHVQAVIYFSNGFEDFPTGWTVVTNAAGTITKSNVEFHGGSWSCRVYTPVAFDKAYAYRAITEATGDHHLQFMLFVPTGQEPVTVQVVGLFDIGVGYSIIAYLDYHDSAVYLFQPTGFLDIGIITTNTWHKVDGYFNDTSNKVNWYIDNTFQIELDAENEGVANPDRIYIGDTSQAAQAANDVFYIDDIFVDDVPGISPVIPTKFFGAGFNGSTPVVDLYWTHDLEVTDFFEIQNSTDKVSWDYLGSNTTAEYHDFQVVNGTERYYRVRGCRFIDPDWVNSTWSDINFETVYFIEAVGVGNGVCEYHIFNASSIEVITGTLDSGNIASTYFVDGDWYNVTETNTPPGLDIRFNFTNIGGNITCGCVEIYQIYTGHSHHEIQIQAWNFTSTSWHKIGKVLFNETADWVCIGLGHKPEHYLNNGTIWFRFYHPLSGHLAHTLHIDRIDLRVVYAELCPAIGAAARPEGWVLTIMITAIGGTLIILGTRRRRK